MSEQIKGDGARRFRQTTTGALLIVSGVILFLVQQGMIEVVSIWRYWPVVLITVGLMKLVSPRPGRDLAAGTLEVLAGAWFLACNLHWYGFTYRQTWPLIFVVIGLSQIIKSLGGRSTSTAAVMKENGHA
jgi:cell wall-active antibiotic response 4TMS protein YvqF